MLDNIFSQKEYSSEAKAMSSSFFANVYTYMFLALAISGGIAYYIGTSPLVSIGHGRFLPELFAEYFWNGKGFSGLFWVAMFLPVGLALLMQMALHRLSMTVLILLFGLYAACMGFTLSTIFLVYSIESIALTFFITAGTFAVMAILGYTTKTDLTKFGSILYMALFGVIIGMLVNMFMRSEAFDYFISLICVFIFTGLVAFKMQQLKYIGEDPNIGQLDKSKLSVIGALTLYITFINLFLTLLRLFGNRD